MASDIRMRAANEGDLEFVLKTWLRSAADVRGRIRAREAARIAMAVYTGRADIDVLCLADSPIYILGWIAREGGRVRWVYVRDTYRGRGLGAMLRKEKR